jgi:hypothetical protein
MAVVAILLAGLVAGAVTGAAAHPPPVPGVQPLVTVRLRAIVLGERPAAVLTLGLESLGGEPLVAQDAEVSGAGLEPTTVTLTRTLRPGVPEEADVSAPLTCSGNEGAGTPVRVVVRLRLPGGAATAGAPAAGASTSVTALQIGTAGVRGGLCSTADATLPGGWLEQARAVTWSIGAGRVVHVSIEDLPLDVTDVISAQAGAVLLPLPDAPVPVSAGDAALDLGVPTPGCRDTAAASVVPTGLQLLVHGRDGVRYSYVPVGIALADWLGEAFTSTCPDSPGSASAVRPESVG